MPIVLNSTDSLVVASHRRKANLTSLIDEVRAKDCFHLTPPPSKLAGAADTLAATMLIELWMLIPADGREIQWQQFFEANPEILETTSTVDDFLTKYYAETQQNPPSQLGSFPTANTANSEDGLQGRKRKRDGTRSNHNTAEGSAAASQHHSTTSQSAIEIDPALLAEDEARESARKRTKGSKPPNTPSSHLSSAQKYATDARVPATDDEETEPRNEPAKRTKATQPRRQNPPAPRAPVQSAKRPTATTSSGSSCKGHAKVARPADDEDVDNGALADEDDLPAQSARSRRKAKNDAVSAKKAADQLQAEAEDPRAKKEKCLSVLGPKHGGGWTHEQLELDTEIAATVRNKANRLCGFSKSTPLPLPLDPPTTDRKGNPHLQYDFSCDVNYYGNQETVELVANSIWEDETAAPVLKAPGQPYFTFNHLLKHVKEYFRNLRARYTRENDASKQRKANEKNQVARHSNRQQTLAKNRLAAVPALCDDYPELEGETVKMVVKAEWMSDAWSGPDWDSEDEGRQDKRKAWLRSLGADVDRQSQKPSPRFYRNKKIWETLEQKWRVPQYNWLMSKLDTCIELGKVDVATSTERVRASQDCPQSGKYLRQSTRRWPRTAPPASLIRMKHLPKQSDPDAELVEGWGEWDNPKIADLIDIVTDIMQDENEACQRREDEAAAEVAAAEAKRREKKRREKERAAQSTRAEGRTGSESNDEYENE